MKRARSRALLVRLLLGAGALLAGACGVGDERATAPPAPSPATLSPPAAAAPLVVFLGDSLTAGYGLGEEEAFPARVGAELARRGLAVRVVNAGVSGDTSAGGLARLDWLLQQRPRIVVVGLGANDGLRGLPLAATEENLREILRRAREAGAEVLLLGMMLPPNYGPEYAGAFQALYPRLARELEVGLVPFLLEGVAARPELNLPDGIHPTADGQAIVAGNVLRHLEPMVRGVRAR